MNFGDIDMVYCWCDGNDPEFQKRKNYYLAKEKGEHDSDSVGNHRFVDNEELRYSLRSLNMYAPWIHHVYIVTDRQVPKWLNTDYEKVTVVDHSEIMPKEIIPCFSSPIIEQYITNIPELSECFLYGNDDMFFGRPIKPEFFFTSSGNPIVYVKYFEKFKYIGDEADFMNKYNSVSTWMKTNLNSWKLLYNQYGKHEFYVLAHNIDAYRKTLFQESLKKYHDSLLRSIRSRFRNEKELSRVLINLDAVYSGHGVCKIVETPSFWKKHVYKPKDYSWICYCGSEDEKTRKQIKHFEPYLFCINADSQGQSEDKQAMKEFYEQLFPAASPFEHEGL